MDFRHPLARWLVSASLSQSKILLDIRHALHFLSEPVERFFATPDHDLVPRLKQLAYLAERYKYTTEHPLEVDWRSPFSIDFSFMEVISKPKCLAESDTKDVAEAFRHLSAADILNHNSKRKRSLASRWSALSDNVATLVAADLELGLGYEAEFFEFFELNLNWMN